MAEIDYAFLADYAKVEPTGTLTAVGASFTFLTTPGGFPGSHRMAVAGRIRARIDEGDINLVIRIKGPKETFSIESGGQLTIGPNARPYGDGKIGHLFALDVQIPLPAPGLYSVEIELPDSPMQRRYLAFEAQAPE